MFMRYAKTVTISAILALSTSMASAGVTGPANSEGWSLFGPVNGSGWGVSGNGGGFNANAQGQGWSIFGPVHGSGWGVNGGSFAPSGNPGWSIFGPVNGSGWSIFGPVHGSGWGVGPNPNGWSIFGPVNGSGWGAQMQQPVQQQQPAFVAIHCSFGEDVMMMAKSVEDCETAGGAVHESMQENASE